MPVHSLSTSFAFKYLLLLYVLRMIKLLSSSHNNSSVQFLKSLFPKSIRSQIDTTENRNVELKKRCCQGKNYLFLKILSQPVFVVFFEYLNDNVQRAIIWVTKELIELLNTSSLFLSLSYPFIVIVLCFCNFMFVWKLNSWEIFFKVIF